MCCPSVWQRKSQEPCFSVEGSWEEAESDSEAGQCSWGWWWPHTWAATCWLRLLGLPWAHQATAVGISQWEVSQDLPGKVLKSSHLGASGWGLQWLLPNLLDIHLLPLTARSFPHLCKQKSYTKCTCIKWLYFPVQVQADTRYLANWHLASILRLHEALAKLLVRNC